MTRSRQKPCSLCIQIAPILYRVQYDASGEWVFACSECWATLSHNNPLYVYGGTWKAKKRD